MVQRPVSATASQRAVVFELCSGSRPSPTNALEGPGTPLNVLADTKRSEQMIEQLLAAIRDHGAKTVIIDITGVPVVDEEVAHNLWQAIKSTRLLGASCVLTGVSPHNAPILAKTSLGLKQVTTVRSLHEGLRLALRSTGKRIVDALQPRPANRV